MYFIKIQMIKYRWKKIQTATNIVQNTSNNNSKNNAYNVSYRLNFILKKILFLSLLMEIPFIIDGMLSVVGHIGTVSNVHI